MNYKKAQLSRTNPRDAKACRKLLQFDVLTTLSVTIILVYPLHSFSCCCVRNLRNADPRNSLKIQTYSSRLSKVIDLDVNRKPMHDFCSLSCEGPFLFPPLSLPSLPLPCREAAHSNTSRGLAGGALGPGRAPPQTHLGAYRAQNRVWWYVTCHIIIH